jgi:hypothetical protein
MWVSQCIYAIYLSTRTIQGITATVTSTSVSILFECLIYAGIPGEPTKEDQRNRNSELMLSMEQEEFISDVVGVRD